MLYSHSQMGCDLKGKKKGALRVIMNKTFFWIFTCVLVNQHIEFQPSQYILKSTNYSKEVGP